MDRLEKGSRELMRLIQPGREVEGASAAEPGIVSGRKPACAC